MTSQDDALHEAFIARALHGPSSALRERVLAVPEENPQDSTAPCLVAGVEGNTRELLRSSGHRRGTRGRRRPRDHQRRSAQHRGASRVLADLACFAYSGPEDPRVGCGRSRPSTRSAPRRGAPTPAIPTTRGRSTRN